MSELFRVVDPSQQEAVKFHLMVLGASGHGKTSFGCTPQHPGLLPALLIDVDKGLSSITRPGWWPGVRVLEPEDMAAIPKLATILKLPEAKQPEWARGVKTVIIDSLSALGEETVAEVAASPLSDTQSAFQAGQRDYLIAQNMLLVAINNLKAVGVNVIAMAGTSTKEEGSSADLSPGLKKKLQYKWSFIWKLKVVTTASGAVLHLIETLPKNEKDELKTRHSGFRRLLETESLPRLKAAGLQSTPANKGIFVLADPMAAKVPDYAVTLDWFYEQFQKVLDS